MKLVEITRDGVLLFGGDGGDGCGRRVWETKKITTNPSFLSPVAWVGKTPLRPLARPQDRSGSPTKGAK
ncbi:MAG: hypothetical protein ACHBN1_35720 [Heteroscytonema crispum UTEX LB 1556]